MKSNKERKNNIFNHPKIKLKGDTLFLNFGEYGEQISIACFSSDGSKLLTVKEVNQATIWDVENGKKIGLIQPTSPLEGKSVRGYKSFKVFIEGAVLNPSGDIALISLNDGTAGLYDVLSGNRLAIFHNPDRDPSYKMEFVSAIKFSKDGSSAFIAFIGYTIGIWDVNTHKLIKVFRNNKEFGIISDISVSNDGKYLFAGNSNSTALIWNIENEEEIWEAPSPPTRIISFNYHNGIIRWANKSGELWEYIPSSPPRKILSTGQTWVQAVFFMHKKTIFCLSRRKILKEWTFDGREKIISEPGLGIGSDSLLNDFGYLNKYDIIYYPEALDKIVFLKGKEGKKIKVLEGKQKFKSAFSILFSSSQKYFAIQFRLYIDIYTLPSFDHLFRIELNSDYRYKPKIFSPNDKFLMLSPYKPNKEGYCILQFWSIADKKLVYELKKHEHIIRVVTFNPKVDRMVTSDNSVIYLWELYDESGNLSPKIRNKMKNPSYSTEIMFLSNEHILFMKNDRVELWRDFDQQLWCVHIPWGFERRWRLIEEKNQLVVELPFNQFGLINLQNGQLECITIKNVPRPWNGGYGHRWKAPGGPYLHLLRNGPRGWTIEQNLSADKSLTVIQAKKGAQLVKFDDNLTLVQKLRFEGKLRASCILDSHILLLNTEGKIYKITRSN